ncbi:hypothetical protein [Tropicimonas sediminicola]|uniref:hypothetical protein n=1 Tax=Tropicimonas sediminicola TaxID=1031541 RepID=UPI001130D896|nr:hypothetical protein [Tropicimonas sediminicola]
MAALLTVTALPASADNIAMCVDTGASEAVCTCAAAALAEQVGPEDLARYDAISTAFVEKRSEGLGWVDAWDGAVAAVAERDGTAANTMQRAMNPVGQAHRDSIKACE